MIRFIVKRDGRKVSFNQLKIANAIRKALISVHPDDGITEHEELLIKDLTAEVVSLIEADVSRTPSVENTQNIIEKVLIKHDLAAEAKNFILYRQQRTNVRTYNEDLTRIYRDLTSKSTADMDLKRENANIDANAPMGLMLRFGSEGAKDFVKRYVLKPEHALAHSNGTIHIHDLDFYLLTINCCQISLKDLFKRGFSTGHGFLREPKSILSAAALCCIAIQSNQNDMHGGQSIPMFEYDLAPYVVVSYLKHLSKVTCISMRCNDIDTSGLTDYGMEVYHKLGTIMSDEAQLLIKDFLVTLLKENSYDCDDEAVAYILNESLMLTDRETYQAMEAVIHNLNSMQSRAGAQVPFSSINYGTGVTKEQRMIMRNVLLVTEAGLGGGETPIFPVQIFKIKDGINTKEGDPNYDLFKLACRVSAKRLFPNFSFLDVPYNKQYYVEGRPETEVALMGCRTRVFGNDYDKTKQVIPGRGNLSFTTVNLPRLAIEAHGSISKFYESLDHVVNMIFDQLLDRFEIIAQKHVYNYPFLMGQGVWIDSDRLSMDDTIRDVIKNGSLSVGFIGLAEALVALTGYHHGESEKSCKLGYEILSHMRDLTDKQTQKTGLNFSLFSTPAEGLSGRFVKMDKNRYGEIKGVTDRDYYTNSFHVPVYYDISAAKKIKIEGPFHELCNAGSITYVEMDGDLTKNTEAFEQIILYMKDCGVGYGSINHPVDRCPVCGFVGVINDVCPKCGRHDGEGVTIERLSKIGVECICKG
ncbi:Anaerobic ribonucleoside-triphosphate reductase [Anaerobiospirillum thomasii]|uniref:anaerobic ribonucleoside triphosphate reductase n=1 Tax=Anaerobiospirillum thomasii TaxID=179995 RepID=UPI000D8867CE|nr:anaerobic ribonucleoside triphosphate reductase [Anaerobiospirillum thomasii]SPT72276.1 Anaerobic ribonucleoside-triphosphate reductase [Anaerobiospirillum thomasii]